uniref:DUF3627 domain-containing protein n=1 Tax=viral metagenome TaxID=1070528 RepID=A0A6C0CSX7_9ZZZZ
MNTTTLSTLFNNNSFASNVEKFNWIIDITKHIISIAEFAIRTGVELDEECLLLCQRIHNKKDTDPIKLDRSMLQIVGFRNTFTEKTNKKGTVKLMDERTDFHNAKRCLTKIFPCGNSPDDIDKQWFIVKTGSPTGLPVLQNGGQNKEDIYVRRQAFEIFNAVANTDKSQRNMIFLITIKNLVFDYQMYFMAYMLKKDEYNLSLKDDKIDTLTYEITTLVTENKQQSYEIKDLKSRFEHLMTRTEDIHDKLDEQKIENGELKTEVVHIRETIEQVNEHVVPEIKERLLTDHFVILHDHDITNHYYIIRAQKRAISTAIRTVKKLHPNMYVLLNEIDYTHPKNLFVIFKKYITDNVQYTSKIQIVYNHIRVCEEYTTPSTSQTDHELVRLFETVKTTIMNDVRDTMIV